MTTQGSRGSGEGGRVQSADLFIQQGDLVGQEARFREALAHLPGVRAVGEIGGPERERAAEASVRVDYDPETTNPLILREALQRAGFTVLSAAEDS